MCMFILLVAHICLAWIELRSNRKKPMTILTHSADTLRYTFMLDLEAVHDNYNFAYVRGVSKQLRPLRADTTTHAHRVVD